MNTPPDLCVAVCTHNRPQRLDDLLNRMASALGSLGVEIIVVDSASNPAAAAAVRTSVEAHPNVRLIRNDQPGVSLARNTALAAADTKWIAFVDDDELPRADWPEAVAALIERLPDDCAGCGGDVTPAWPSMSLPVIGKRWADYLSIIKMSGEFDQSEAPMFGIGHSVMRVAALRATGGFDVRLGRDGSSLLSGEEVLLIERLLHQGWRIWHSDRIEVEHIIEPERLQRSWAVKRAWWEGVSKARVLDIIDNAAYRRLARAAFIKFPFLLILRDVAQNRFEFDLRLAFALGVLGEHVRLRRTQRRREGDARPVIGDAEPQLSVAARQAVRVVSRAGSPGGRPRAA
ncbi:MAG: glycosyltransferase [Caulobacteraceae bacterium]